MGLLDGNTHRELHLVRKIRNEFGHQHEPPSFATDAIKKRCTELNRVPRRSDDPRHLHANSNGPFGSNPFSIGASDSAGCPG
jgi:hypothetical protein